MTVHELYEQTIKYFSASERLQLAMQILNDIPANALMDYSTEWSEEDKQDAAKYSTHLANAMMDDE